ncbi:putative tetratricopeptide-like helical domain superfamily [Helianthus annuus]|nr:putative tetratricopeptide-like helical domain superfamily [Helianthus annuus]
MLCIRTIIHLFSMIIKPHHESSHHLCKLASFCALSPHGNLSYAKTIFNQHQNPTLQLCNSLIRGFSTSLVPQETLLLFRKMIVCNNVKPNNMTFPFVIKACTVLFRVKFGILVHNYVLKYGLECDLYVRSSLVKFYANAKCLRSAKLLFDGYPEKDVVCWNSMIDAYVKAGEMELTPLKL